MPFFEGLNGRIHYRTWSIHQRHAIVVFLHGRGQHSGDYHRFSRAMRRHQIEIWAIDHVGHGLSEGESQSISLGELAANTVHLVGAAQAGATAPLVLMGHSLGAATALIVMRSNTPEVRAITAVVLCGTPEQVATPALGGPAVPTLVLHGVDDRMTPIEPIREWASRNPVVDMREYPNAGHNLLHEPIRSIVTDDVAQFVLQPPRLSATPAHQRPRQRSD